MNLRLQQNPGRVLTACTRALLLLGLVVTVGGSGCASRRPARIAIEGSAGGSTSATSSRSAVNIKLVTYNVLGLPTWMTGARSARYPQIRNELERLDPDIILLQEAWTGKARKAAPSDGRWSVARARGQHTFFQQNGLMTLSKFPIVGGEFYPFAREAFPDRFVNKGALKVTVQMQDGRLVNVWNVHLQQGKSPEIRRWQALEVVSLVQGAEDGQMADIIGGDFNCTPGSELHEELEALLGPSVHQLGGCEPLVTWIRLMGRPASAKMLDYVFIRPRVPVEELHGAQRVVLETREEERRLSDHLGLEARVNLKPATRLVEAGGISLRSASEPDREGAQLGGGQ